MTYSTWYSFTNNGSFKYYEEPTLWSITFKDSGKLKTEDPYRPEDDKNYQKFDNPANGLSNLLGLRSAKDE